MKRAHLPAPECSPVTGTMSTTTQIVVSLVTGLTLWFVVSCMDIIPAEVAPVVRPELQRYERTRVSLQMLYGLGRAFSGVSYRSIDSTPWVALGVSGVAILAGGGTGYIVCRCIDRRGRTRRGPPETTALSTTSSDV